MLVLGTDPTTITPERAKVVSFSAPYSRRAQAFIVRGGNPGKLAQAGSDLAAARLRASGEDRRLLNQVNRTEVTV